MSLAILAAGCGSTVPPAPTSPPIRTPSASLATSTPTVAPSSSLEASLLRWTAIDLPTPADGRPSVLGVVAFNGAYIAVGALWNACTCDWPSLDRSVLWTSPDGRSWTLHDDIAAFAESSLRGVVTDGRRLVAFGYAMPGTGRDDARVPAAWSSADGVTWTRSPDPAPSVVVVGLAGFVGAIPVNRYSNPAAAAAAVEFVASADGLTWRSTSELFDAYLGDESEASSPFGDQVLAVSPSGGVMAIGSRSVDRSSPSSVVLWHSADGATWGEPSVVTQDATPVAIAASGDAFLVTVASSLSDDAPHGEIWRIAGDTVSTVFTAEDGTRIGHIFSVDGLVIAEGIDETPHGRVAWASTDGGASFSRIENMSPFIAGSTTRVTSLLRSPDGLIATGVDDTGGVDERPVVWIGR